MEGWGGCNFIRVTGTGGQVGSVTANLPNTDE